MLNNQRVNKYNPKRFLLMEITGNFAGGFFKHYKIINVHIMGYIYNG